MGRHHETAQNPFSIQEFAEDTLCVLDLQATDMLGSIYQVEVQMASSGGFREWMVYYPQQMYGAQLRSGDDYSQLKPVYSIYLVGGKLWPNSKVVHQTFRLADCLTGRVLNRTLEIHTPELGCYNLHKAGLGTASVLDRWFFWLLRAQDYSHEGLERLFPDGPIFEVTRIPEGNSEQTEDKAMYDAGEKKLRDHLWLMNATRIDREQT